MLSFWSLILHNSEPFLKSDCDMWRQVSFIWQPVTTSSVTGPRSSSKALPTADAPVKGHGPCLVVCGWSHSLQLSESRQNHYLGEVCSANRWDALKTATPTASTDQQTGPSSSPGQRLTVCRTTDASKVRRSRLQTRLIRHIHLLLLFSHPVASDSADPWTAAHQASLSLIISQSLPKFPWPLTNRLPLLQAYWQLFAGKVLPQPAGGRKCFPRICQILKCRFLCYRNKQIYFLLAKMCWLQRFLFWLIKMCLSLVIMI